MQFLIRDMEEYIDTIESIINANIYQETALAYALDINKDGTVNIVPGKFPVIVSLELDEYSADNRRYAFSGAKFIYLDDTLDGYDYSEKLAELAVLDGQLAFLEEQLNTSGMIDKPFDEISKIQKKIANIEEMLF